MALVSGRFRLDPRSPAPERQLPPPPTLASTPPVRPPPPRPPAPTAAPAAKKPANRRIVLLGASALAVLLLGGAVAVYVATALGYPDKYVLDADEMPAGMSNARLSANDREESGLRSNPGEMDRDKLEQDMPLDPSPDRGYAQILATSDGSRVVSVAFKYADEEAARSSTTQLRAVCSFADGIVLRDADVVVMIFPEDGATRSNARAVANALIDKTGGDLVSVCGA